MIAGIYGRFLSFVLYGGFLKWWYPQIRTGIPFCKPSILFHKSGCPSSRYPHISSYFNPKSSINWGTQRMETLLFQFRQSFPSPYAGAKRQNKVRPTPCTTPVLRDITDSTASDVWKSLNILNQFQTPSSKYTLWRDVYQLDIWSSDWGNIMIFLT